LGGRKSDSYHAKIKAKKADNLGEGKVRHAFKRGRNKKKKWRRRKMNIGEGEGGKAPASPDPG